MAYYDALIAKWATLTPGTTAQKLAQLNAVTVTGSVPTSFNITGDQLLNCINWSEFAALSAQQQSNMLSICKAGTLLGGSANTSRMAPGAVIAYFPGGGSTITALTALAQAAVQPWWQANGYSSPIGPGDLAVAGLS